MEATIRRWGGKVLPTPIKRFLRSRPTLRYLVRIGRRILKTAPPSGPSPVVAVASAAPQSVEQQKASYLEDCRRQAAALDYRPLISIVVPTYNTPLDLLDKMFSSVMRQIYPDWELCVVDDCSPREEVREFIRQRNLGDARIRALFRGSNGNIAASTNDGISLSSGEYVAFLDHDDELTEDALYHVVRLLNEKPDTDLIYTDQDRIAHDGSPLGPFFKPDWSPEYFRGAMYLGHLVVVRRSLLMEVGGCDGRFNGMQDYELELRLTEKTDRIEHLPYVLYHWRATPGSVAADINAKPNVDFLQERAVQEHLDRLGIPATATALGGHRVRLRPPMKRSRPLVSLLIPTRDRPELIGNCLKSLYERTSYEPFEVVLGDNETTDLEALAHFERYPVKRVPLAGAFHFSRFTNQMAAAASGDFLVLLNNDTEMLYSDWLDHLLLYAEQPDVGAVGPLLLYPDGTVQHAGVILGPRGTADHVLRGVGAQLDGYAGSLRCAREVSAVTGACLMVSKEKYFAVGGLNEFFVCHYEDVDFCLRLRRRNWRNIYVASTALIHHESKSRGPRYNYTDRVLLLDYWEPCIEAGDPYYSRNFDPLRVDYAPRSA